LVNYKKIIIAQQIQTEQNLSGFSAKVTSTRLFIT
jgi:hypothetical protein